MNTTNSPKFVLLLFISMLSLALSGQASKEAVILVNTDPVRAEISYSGEINKIISREPNYLSGFKLVAYNFAATPTEPVAVIETLPTVNEGYSVVSAKYHEILFDQGFATLRKDAIAELDLIIENLSSNSNRKVLIANFAEFEDELLHRNRINSVKTYLKVKGIDASRVQTNRLMGSYNANTVRINYLD